MMNSGPWRIKPKMLTPSRQSRNRALVVASDPRSSVVVEAFAVDAPLIAAAPEMVHLLEDLTEAYDALLDAWMERTGEGYGWGKIRTQVVRDLLRDLKRGVYCPEPKD